MPKYKVGDILKYKGNELYYLIEITDIKNGWYFYRYLTRKDLNGTFTWLVKSLDTVPELGLASEMDVILYG